MKMNYHSYIKGELHCDVIICKNTEQMDHFVKIFSAARLKMCVRRSCFRIWNFSAKTCIFEDFYFTTTCWLCWYCASVSTDVEENCSWYIGVLRHTTTKLLFFFLSNKLIILWSIKSSNYVSYLFHPTSSEMSTYYSDHWFVNTEISEKCKGNI